MSNRTTNDRATELVGSLFLTAVIWGILGVTLVKIFAGES